MELAIRAQPETYSIGIVGLTLKEFRALRKTLNDAYFKAKPDSLSEQLLLRITDDMDAKDTIPAFMIDEDGEEI